MGLILGLYLQKSIVLFLFILVITLFYSNLKSNKYKIVVFTIMLLLGYVYMSQISINKNKMEKKIITLEEKESIIIYGNVCSNIKKGEYKDSFYINVEKTNVNNKEFNIKNIKLNIYIKDSDKYDIMQGDYIKVVGKFDTISSYNNFGIFNYKQYLKRKNIYGNIQCSNLTVVKRSKSKVTYIRFKLINYIKKKIKDNIQNSALLTGILIGDKSELSDETMEEFKNSNLSHILAVSGTHISILITLFSMFLDKIIKNYKIKNTIIIILLIFFLFIVGNTPSVLRAVIMSCLVIISKLVYRKSNNINNLLLSAFIILIINPYYLFDLGFQLSFLATLGIILFVRIFEKKISYVLKQDKKLKFRIIKYIISTSVVSASANILIIPIVMYNTNNLSFNFVISNIIVSPLIFILEMLGIIFLFLPNISLLNHLIEIILYLIANTAKYCSKIKILSFLMSTPNIIEILIYYFLIYLVYRILVDKKLRRRMKLYVKKINIFIKINKYKIISIVVISIIFIFIISRIYILNSKLEIQFLDVAQGDATLIVTKERKRILIDGGGSESYDVGSNVIKPYLLKKKIKLLDYVIISHMDTDHCKGVFTIMEELKVKNVVIGKQFEDSNNYKRFIDIATNRKIRVIVVEGGQRINIEKDLYFDILWPNQKSIINENVLNNNSLVCKLVYNNLSILFTGDIEAVAEKEILKIYANTDILKSKILKVAHHGSKTSSIEEFVKKVNPSIALIGVGKNNKFKHPSSITLECLNNIKCNIYRTDKDGEIILKINKNEVEIDKYIKP